VAHVPFFLMLEGETRSLSLISDHYSSDASSPMKRVPFFERPFCCDRQPHPPLGYRAFRGEMSRKSTVKLPIREKEMILAAKK
jgi:hypothetical protein